MKLKQVKQLVSWSIVGVVLILLFVFSGQNGEESAKVSQGITDIVIMFLESVCPVLDFDWLYHAIRKMAHFTLFALLGVGLCGAIEGIVVKNKFLCILLIGFTIACSDEIHQLFSAGRSASFADVLLDESGVVAGYCLYAGIGRISGKFIKKN